MLNTIPNIGFDFPGLFLLKIVPVGKNNPHYGERPNQVVFFIVKNILKDELAGTGNKSDPAPNKKVYAAIRNILFCFADHRLDKPEAILR